MPLTLAQVIDRADTCERLADQIADGEKRMMLLHMRDLWKGLAEVVEAGGNLDREYDQLLAIQERIAGSTDMLQ